MKPRWRRLIAVTLSGPVGGRDRLFIDTTGFSTGEWAFRVSDTGGNPLATERLGTGLVAEVPGPGNYEVVASVTARAAAAARDSLAQRLRASVRVASLRNAIAAATGRYPTPDEVPFDAVISAGDIRVDSTGAGELPAVRLSPAARGSSMPRCARSGSVARGRAAIDLVFAGTKRAPSTWLIGRQRFAGTRLYFTSAHLDPSLQDRRKRDLADAAAKLAGRIAANHPIAPRQEGGQAVIGSRYLGRRVRRGGEYAARVPGTPAGDRLTARRGLAAPEPARAARGGEAG
jgi:hypothetical protein